MLYETLSIALWLFAANVVVVVFFCNVEWAPVVVRRMAREVRFAGPERKEKLVRFW
ncbi:MAG: hypothetical protein V3571_10305 [Pseudodesulfovibrio sp.]